ncbi:hypothetical protein B0F90DRAFT_1631745 [Multifurca ochricompacta]|uniref:Wax synthase domain-containing protein n=1 Tax=Multifurca ochricompacta TaxID=376703 RepID=A0AAD4M3M5_9AGAM|nr:hypothetical protein B0F90DRAFT_1631745 [Multifurca ochricompacta]
MFALLPDLPDPALRQPFTIAAVCPLFLSYYALGVLAILPNTFLIKLSLLPFIVWQVWRCALGLDPSLRLGQLLGRESPGRFSLWNFEFVMLMFCFTLKSFEWVFIMEPLRKYELLKDQDTPLERPLTISNVLLDGLDLLYNQRGIGWSWSSNPFLGRNTPPLSIFSVLAKLLIKVTVLDASQYLIQCICPSVNIPGGISFMDPSLTIWHRTAVAAFSSMLGFAWTWAVIDSAYHIGSLIGRTLLCQSASQWPPSSHRPWLSTSLHELWSFRWHQLLRHFFVTFGARPCGKIFGRMGALMGAFAVSGILHHVALWGLGYGTEFKTAGGFFFIMGLGTVMEEEFTKATGLRVRGLLGWLWTMTWTVFWGVFMLDAWARRGLFSTDFSRSMFVLVNSLSILPCS